MANNEQTKAETQHKKPKTRVETLGDSELTSAGEHMTHTSKSNIVIFTQESSLKCLCEENVYVFMDGTI